MPTSSSILSSNPVTENRSGGAFAFLQSLGKTFIINISLLAAGGILLGVGSALTSTAVKNSFPFLSHEWLQHLFLWMTKIGSIPFMYLSLLFTLAIALGLAKTEKGVAAFSAFVAYVATNLAINVHLSIAGVLGDAAAEKAFGVKNILGVDAIDTGVLGAVVIGVITAKLHNRYHSIRLPDALAFFGGPRFVPIVCSLVLGVVGLFVPVIWPYFSAGINSIGTLISSSGPFGPFLFGAGERLLLPFGLHHILVALIRFTEAGGVATVCGSEVVGALNIFSAELACPTTTQFSDTVAFLSQGKMPVFLGGGLGGMLAMYHCAHASNKGKIKALFLSATVAMVVGGVTEPFEFAFLFVAPGLYLIHAFLTGLGFMTMGLLGATIGFTDGNIIDLVVFGMLQGTATKWYLVPVVAGIWFVLYYVIFRFAIEKYQLKTPGREANANDPHSATGGYDCSTILKALGGSQNIQTLDNCITRLRLTVNDMSLIDEEQLKACGAIGVVKLNQYSLQVIIGMQVQSVKDEVQRLMSHSE